jgi:transcription antitermination factor NusG
VQSGIELTTQASIAITTNASQVCAHDSGIAYDEPRWYAVYTCANHEKRIAMQLNERSIENFLPLYETVRRWKDRRMQLEVPLFPGYIFIHHPLRDRLRVLQVPGVVRFVGFNGQPAVLKADEILPFRKCLNGTSPAKPHPYLAAGQRVGLLRGPFEGLEGLLLRRKGNLRVVLSIHLIMRSVAVDVDVADIHVLR